MEQTKNKTTEETDHIRQIAQLAVLYENLKKAKEMKIPFVTHFAQKRYDEHVEKMNEFIEESKREIAAAQQQQPGRTFSEEEIANTYKETWEDLEKEIAKQKRNPPK
jgi:hypothetical protein